MTTISSLGHRMKRMEAAYSHVLTPRSDVIIRVDGKKFHTWTRGMDKPYSLPLIEAMAAATALTAKQMGGFRLAYTQSDEATFLITDYARLNTEGWFDYSVNKLVSVTASMFTAYFNDEIRRHVSKPLAFFDARAFVVPTDDVPNVFLWRQQDWERNSIQMLAQSMYSPKELHGKKIPDLHEMLYAKGVNWASLPDYLKNGTYVTVDGYSHDKETYDTINEYLNSFEKED